VPEDRRIFAACPGEGGVNPLGDDAGGVGGAGGGGAGGRAPPGGMGGNSLGAVLPRGGVSPNALIKEIEVSLICLLICNESNAGQ
jgi:hypothetical protein